MMATFLGFTIETINKHGLSLETAKSMKHSYRLL